ncbi:MAG: hypothetical protein J3K34DRAFT_522750 [Monoraphidium minutum]|nr:MAG: hypothetical protein J3K34DRAFT_522750 [Monoraphidium minutum]
MDVAKCNCCWQSLSPGGKCIFTQCNHLFCYNCAEAIVVNASGCSLCGGTITKNNVKSIRINTQGDLQFAMIGVAPEVALRAAATSVEFYRKQQAAAEAAREQELKTKCEAQLGKIHNAYTASKRKCEALSQELHEIAAKYELKSKQARHLHDMMAQLQLQQQQRGQMVMGHGGGGGGGGGSARMSPMVGGMDGRGGGGGHHTVTTVRRTAVFNMSPNTGAMMGGAFQQANRSLRPPSNGHAAGGGGAFGSSGQASRGANNGLLGSLLNGGGGGGMGLPMESPAGQQHMGGPRGRGGVGGGGMFANLDRLQVGLSSADRHGGGGGGGGMGGAGAALHTLLGGGGGSAARHASAGGGLFAGARGGFNLMSPSMNTL